MRVPKTTVDVVRVLIGVRKWVVLAVLRGPLERGLLKRRAPEKKQKKADEGICFVSRVSEQAVITHGDRQAGQLMKCPQLLAIGEGLNCGLCNATGGGGGVVDVVGEMGEILWSCGGGIGE